MIKARSYEPRMRADWWLAKAGYFRYMMREVTCIFVGAYAVFTVIGLVRLAQGPEAWAAFLAASASGPGLVFQATTLLIVLYHTVTWFALAPSSMPLHVGKRRVPAAAITGAHYVVFVLITLLVLWLGGR